MKKLSFKLMLLLMGVLAIGVFASCSDDDDDNEITAANLLGKWTLEKIMVNGVEDTEEEEECDSKRDYNEYLADGKLNVIWYNSNCEEETNTSPSTWALKGTMLTETYSNGDHVYKYSIRELNANVLVLHSEKEYGYGKEVIIDWDDDGKADDVTIYLKRMK